MPCTKPASIPEIPKTWGTASTAQRGQITPGAAVVEDGSTPKTTNHVMITALADMMMLPVGAWGPEDGVLVVAAVFGPEWQQGASSGICLEAEIEDMEDITEATEDMEAERAGVAGVEVVAAVVFQVVVFKAAVFQVVVLVQVVHEAHLDMAVQDADESYLNAYYTVPQLS